MLILNSTLETKELIITPRSEVMDLFQLTDESSNITNEYDIRDIIVNEYYTTIFIDFSDPLKPLIQNRFYMVNIYNQGALIFRDKIFCTDQSVFTYSVNVLNDGENTYKSKPSLNEYIPYGE